MRVGASEVLPLQKGDTKSFSHAEGGGGTKSCEIVLTQELVVLAILKGAAKSFHLSRLALGLNLF